MSSQLIEQILAWGTSAPYAPALVSARVRMTYSELASAVRRTASRLRQLGLRPGQVVGIYAAPELEAVLTLAVLHEGAMSLHASQSVISGYGDHIQLYLGAPPDAVGVSAPLVAVDERFIESLGAVNSEIEPRPLSLEDPVRIVFSSGTTGVPKGIAFTEPVLRVRTDSARANWMPHDPFFCQLGIETVSGFQTFLWSTLHGQKWIVPGDDAANVQLLRSEGVRSIKTSPARLAQFLDAIDQVGNAGIILETVQVAGSLLSASLVRRCIETLGVTPTYLYGSTEAGTVSRGFAKLENVAIVGSIVDGATVRVLDQEGNVIERPDVVGSIEYRTISTARAYWKRELHPSPFADGWFRPGDRGSIGVDKVLTLGGREGDVVNAGGSKVNLSELDRRLAEMYEVSDAASFDYLHASGLTAIGVAFVPRDDVSVDEAMRRITEVLPGVWLGAMIRVGGVPRNNLGKIMRSQLRAQISREA